MRDTMGEEAVLLAHDLGRHFQDGACALVERARLNALKEQFFAVSQQRRYPNPLVAELIGSRSKKAG